MKMSNIIKIIRVGLLYFIIAALIEYILDYGSLKSIFISSTCISIIGSVVYYFQYIRIKKKS